MVGVFHTHSQSITYCMLNEEVHLIRNNQHFKYFFNKAHVTATQQVSPATSICICVVVEELLQSLGKDLNSCPMLV